MTTKDNSIINAKLLQEYNLQYLKENNDLITSVKKETAEQLILSGVSQQREQLIAVINFINKNYLMRELDADMIADDFESN